MEQHKTGTSFQRAQRDIRAQANTEKAMLLQRFFKTGIGQYGEGDVFLGVMVPVIRKQVRMYADMLSIDDAERFLQSPWHEERLFGLLVLVKKFET